MNIYSIRPEVLIRIGQGTWGPGIHTTEQQQQQQQKTPHVKSSNSLWWSRLPKECRTLDTFAPASGAVRHQNAWSVRRLTALASPHNRHITSMRPPHSRRLRSFILYKL